MAKKGKGGARHGGGKRQTSEPETFKDDVFEAEDLEAPEERKGWERRFDVSGLHAHAFARPAAGLGRLHIHRALQDPLHALILQPTPQPPLRAACMPIGPLLHPS